jgi:uncharacterized membrane protein
MKTKLLLQAAIIAAVYAVLTIALSAISYGPMQVRVSEALTVLAGLTPAAVPGLIIGCVIANLASPVGIVDVIFGSLATALAAAASYKLRKYDWLVPLPPVIANGIIVGLVLHYAYAVPNLWACMGWVALGELIACYVIGLPLLKIFRRYPKLFSSAEEDEKKYR